MEFNKTLQRDGMWVSADGLQPSAKGARIRYASSRPLVIDGPFTETKELMAGFWILQAASKEELVERFLDCPAGDGSHIEIRQIIGPGDFATR